MLLRRYYTVILGFFFNLISWIRVFAEISSGRIKGKDEPQLVSWKVLEGITEPFGTNYENSIPVWKQMKASADQKAGNMAIQQALHEYGQILRHPYVFGEMPSEERYDVFLSMAKLLKAMGFHQRAEVILHEAMTHTNNAYEANFQLGLLFLDKEDLETAKLYFKNCLFYQESDLLILSYLTMILITEGKLHEATFFLSRIIGGLEERIRKLSSFLLTPETKIQLSSPTATATTTTGTATPNPDYKQLVNWLEDVIVKIFYGEFRITPSSTIEMHKYFSQLYSWIQSGEMIGRFVFDLGQSLYEVGRPKTGLLMMKRGYETSNAEEEGIVSTEIVKLRLAFETPVVAGSLLEMIEAYLNMTTFLSLTSKNYTKIDIENVMDMYWPIPLLGWSALPVTPVQRELLWRFTKNLNRTDHWSQEWLQVANHQIIASAYDEWRKASFKTVEAVEVEGFMQNSRDLKEDVAEYEDLLESSAHGSRSSNKGKENTPHKRKHKSFVVPPSEGQTGETVHIEVGIFGGHMNNHPVGLMTLQNIIQQIKEDPIFGNVGKSNSNKHQTSLIHITLISLPLIPDAVTKRIANKVDRIVNIPMDTRQAIKVLQELQLDLILFPDWQPFPDQQSLVFQSVRIAPIQICYYVRGTSCASNAIDYYLLPEEIENYYFSSVPAAASNAVKKMNVTSTLQFTAKSKILGRPLRPAWRELFLEQVIIVKNWPLLTSSAIESHISIIQLDNSAAQNRKTQGGGNNVPVSGAPSTSSSSSSGSADITGSLTSFAIMEDYFSPNEYEGKIFFKDQPVAILPIYPHYLHPLMDDLLFKIMRGIPILQILIVIPDSFFTHIHDGRHKLSWARKLVRRLWEKGGNLSHRIRLLPSPFSDYRMLQLIRQTDVVLDTFPIGSAPYFLGMALSVGTPVITLQSGIHLQTPREEVNEIKQYLQHAMNHNNGSFKDHPLRLSINTHSEIPWIASISNIAGFYQRVGLDSYLVANSTGEYYNLALHLLSDREYAYELRVKLLDSLDFDANRDNLEFMGKGERTFSTTTHTFDTSVPPQTFSRKRGRDSIEEAGGLAKTLYQLCIPWAYARHYQIIAKQSSQHKNEKKEKNQKSSSSNSIADGFEDFLKNTIGTIVH